jgi:repressor LexA
MAHTPPGESREKVFRFVQECIFAGQPPTVREVQGALGFGAYESARLHLENLVAEGRLVKEAGKARGYGLPGGAAAGAWHLAPLVGQVQAGDLTAAIQQPEGYVPVQSRAPRGELFALRVRGQSMREAGILEGDIAIVRRQQVAENGEIVVALVGDEATVKRLRRRRGRVELWPENPDFTPIVPEPGELTLLGKVVEIRRYLEGESLIEVAP